MNFERERIKSSPSGYSDTFILVAGDIINIIVNAENYTDVVFNNCAPFSTCKTEINVSLLMKQIAFTLQCLCTN